MTFLGFAALSGISLQGYSANKGLSGGGIYGAGNTFSLNTNTIVLFIFVLAVALVLSWTYFTLARAFTKQFIWITGILNILFGIGTAIYYFVRHYYSAAVVFAVFGIFSIVCTFQSLFFLFREIFQVTRHSQKALDIPPDYCIARTFTSKKNADSEVSLGVLRHVDSEDSIQRGHASADDGCRQVLRACLPRQRYWRCSFCCLWCLVFPYFSLW